MFTPVTPETAVEIENKFREARTVGDFVTAATLANVAMNPTESGVHAKVRQFNDALNAALVEVLGADFALRPVPDVPLLIDDHAAIVGTVSGLLIRADRKEQA